MTPPLPMIVDGVWFIDHSSLEYIMACSRKAEYHLLLKRKTADERIALSFGGAVHAALDGLAQTGDFRPALAKAFESVQTPAGDHRDILKATEMLDDYYHSDYLMHDWTVVEHAGKKLVELPFALPLGTVRDIKIVWTGRIDQIVRRDQGLYVLDHKTTSVFGASYYDQFQHSSQTLGYMWAGQKYLGETFRGFIINVFPVRKSRGPTKGEPARQRIFLIDQDNLEEWKYNTLAILDGFLGLAADGYYPKMTNQCTSKFGRCEYFDVCMLPPESRRQFLASNAFTDVTWSPLNRENHI